MPLSADCYHHGDVSFECKCCQDLPYDEMSTNSALSSLTHAESTPFTRSHANQDYSHTLFLFMPGAGMWPVVLQIPEIVESNCHVF